MGFLKVLNHVQHCYTNNDGQVIKEQILKEIQNNDNVVVSFEGVDSVSSSFLNTALIDLLEIYSFNEIKQKIKFSNSSKSINDAIKRRFSFEVNERKNMISV